MGPDIRWPTSGRCIPVRANAYASETLLQSYNRAVGTDGGSEYQFKVLARPGLEPEIFQLQRNDLPRQVGSDQMGMDQMRLGLMGSD
jgi:hypothetical protein